MEYFNVCIVIFYWKINTSCIKLNNNAVHQVICENQDFTGI